MSQVIVTNDRYKDKRAASGDQERKITRYAGIERWQRSDVTKPDPLARSVGPLVALAFGWITAISALVIGILNFVIFRPLGMIFGGGRRQSK